MTVMRLVLRSRAVGLAPLLLLVLVTALVSGCSAGVDPEDSGPTVTATGPEGSADESTTESTEEPTDEPTTESTTGPTEETSTAPDLPATVAALCTPYSVMVAAIQEAALSHTDPDQIAAAIAPVMKEFAAQVPDLQRPPGVSAEIWGGIEALAERILALPNRPTDDEIEAVEGQLTPEQRDAVAAAATWFKTTCGL
jgi:hypothetical protein